MWKQMIWLLLLQGGNQWRQKGQSLSVDSLPNNDMHYGSLMTQSKEIYFPDFRKIS